MAVTAPGPTARLTTRTVRPDEAVAAARDLVPHRLSVLGPLDAFEMTLGLRHLAAVTVGLVSYGVDVALSCGELDTGYLAVVPLSGRVEARN